MRLSALSLISGLTALAATLLGVAPAGADTFGGFSARENAYLVDRDTCCTPLAVTGGKAHGTPACRTITEDAAARKRFRAGMAQRGDKATHVASAHGTSVVIALRDGGAVVEWDALDPVSSVESLAISEHGALAAVEYTVRIAGRAMNRVVAFAIASNAGTAAAGGAAGGDEGPAAGGDGGGGGAAGGGAAGGGAAVATVPAPTETPAVTKALAAARKAAKGSAKAALAGWQKVLAIDDEQPEALYGLAVALARQKQTADAIATLTVLGKLLRDDAATWVVEARFDKAFAALRDDADFRAAARLDGEPQTVYERLVGMGGVWEQPAVACDTPKVTLTLARRERTFKAEMVARCQGDEEENDFRGTWRPSGDGAELTFPNAGADAEATVCPLVPCGSEQCLRCELDPFIWELRVVRR